MRDSVELHDTPTNTAISEVANLDRFFGKFIASNQSKTLQDIKQALQKACSTAWLSIEEIPELCSQVLDASTPIAIIYHKCLFGSYLEKDTQIYNHLYDRFRFQSFHVIDNVSIVFRFQGLRSARVVSVYLSWLDVPFCWKTFTFLFMMNIVPESN